MVINRMSKKGWLIILEAFLAIMIVAAVLLFVLNRSTKEDISDVVYEKQREILTVIANNESLRNEAISRNNKTINEFIVNTINSNWGYTLNMCDSEDICNQGVPIDRDVYASEIFISANYTDFPGKKITKLRFFIWRK